MTRLDPNHPAVRAALGGDGYPRSRRVRKAADPVPAGDGYVVSEEQGNLLWEIGVAWPDIAVLPEFRFHAVRHWRFDIALPDRKIAIEIDGGVYTGGRHTRGNGFENDAEKHAEALCEGWTVLRVTPGQVKSGQAIGWLRRIIERGEG